jgi:hypothetical protein
VQGFFELDDYKTAASPARRLFTGSSANMAAAWATWHAVSAPQATRSADTTWGCDFQNGVAIDAIVRHRSIDPQRSAILGGAG